MHKARKEIGKRLTQVDLVVEVLDARIPFSSENPMLTELRDKKPCIKILNKSDLADEAETENWLSYFGQHADVVPIALNAKDGGCARVVSAAAKNLLPGKSETLKGIQTLVAGIPNVGKSTLINLLAGKSIAKTGNEPAITKLQQRIDLQNGIVLFDTPGVLWPKVENRNSGFRLAINGAIKDTALDYEEIALFAIDYLTAAYPEALIMRYQLEQLDNDSVRTLESIGRMRGCLIRGGDVDWQRAAKILVSDVRAGALGRLTWETPEMMESELAEVDKLRAEKAAKKAARTEQKKRKKR